jgi:hypothetical protein
MLISTYPSPKWRRYNQNIEALASPLLLLNLIIFKQIKEGEEKICRSSIPFTLPPGNILSGVKIMISPG